MQSKKESLSKRNTVFEGRKKYYLLAIQCGVMISHIETCLGCLNQIRNREVWLVNKWWKKHKLYCLTMEPALDKIEDWMLSVGQDKSFETTTSESTSTDAASYYSFSTTGSDASHKVVKNSKNTSNYIVWILNREICWIICWTIVWLSKWNFLLANHTVQATPKHIMRERKRHQWLPCNRPKVRYYKLIYFQYLVQWYFVSIH